MLPGSMLVSATHYGESSVSRGSGPSVERNSVAWGVLNSLRAYHTVALDWGRQGIIVAAKALTVRPLLKART